MELERQVRADFEQHTKEKSNLTNHNLNGTITARCPYCWVPRIITTNGKCRVCGAVLISQKHWKPTISKLRLFAKHGNFYGKEDERIIPLEINKLLYLVPLKYLEKFIDSEHNGYKAQVELVEMIRKECKSYHIERG